MFAEMFAQLGKCLNLSLFKSMSKGRLDCMIPLNESDLLILCASPVTIHSNDVHHPYRTQSNLLYLTGWMEPDAVFCAKHNGKNWESHLFVQPKDTLKEIWEGRRPGIEGAIADWPIDNAHSVE